MSAATRTAPSGATVPAAIRETPTISPAADDEQLAHLEAVGRTGAMNALNVVAQQAGIIEQQRREIARLADEVEGLKRHIVAMARAE